MFRILLSIAFILAAFVAPLTTAHNAFAMSKSNPEVLQEPAPPVPVKAKEPPKQVPLKIEPKKKKKRVIKYHPITRSTLSQLYWKMGAYKTTNDIDVDNFLLLNRCDLYKKHYRDDFEWHKVRAKAQKSLAKHMKSFPIRFEFLQPIRLGRYNFRDSSFPLAHPINTSRFEVKAERDWPCKSFVRGGGVHRYPDTAIVNFSSALEVRSIEVPHDIAKLYNKLYRNLGIYADRPAWILVKFKAFEAFPYSSRTLTQFAPAKISAILEKVDFYADYEMKLHMHSIDFRNVNRALMTGEYLDEEMDALKVRQ